jgi:quercetin dioxygenase-like cupin family protein
LPDAWRSILIGKAAGANVKVLRVNDLPYPDETHDFDEALLVIEGQMNLQIHNQVLALQQGKVYLVPAGILHAVAKGSKGTLVIIDR